MSQRMRTNQWRIQDFPEVGAPTYDFAKISQKMQLKEFGPRGVTRLKFYYVDPPLRTRVPVAGHTCCHVLVCRSMRISTRYVVSSGMFKWTERVIWQKVKSKRTKQKCYEIRKQCLKVRHGLQSDIQFTSCLFVHGAHDSTRHPSRR